MSNSFATPWTAALQAPVSMGFPRQEYWSGFPFASPGDLINPGVKPTLLHWQKYSLPLSHEELLPSAPKNWCFWTSVLKKTLESPLDCKEIQPVHSKEDQSWVFFGRNDGKAETPVLWPPHAKSWLIAKDSDAGRDWGQEEKWMTEDEMAGWHHWLDGHEFEWTLGVSDRQGGLACCNSWVTKSRTRLSNWTVLNWNQIRTT